MKTFADVLRLFSCDPVTGKLIYRVGTIKKRPGDEAGSPNGEGYLQVKVNGRTYRVSILLWLLYYGEWPVMEIDHINRIRTDNRIENLRCVSRKVNGRNRSLQTTNTSGHTGVSWSYAKGKWLVQLNHKHIGYFRTKEQAIEARNAASKESEQ